MFALYVRLGPNFCLPRQQALLSGEDLYSDLEMGMTWHPRTSQTFSCLSMLLKPFLHVLHTHLSLLVSVLPDLFCT